MGRFSIKLPFIAALAAASLAHANDAALNAQSYIQPPQAIKDLVLAPRHLNVSLSNESPDGRYFLIARSGGMTKLADIAKPYVNLGGVRIDTEANRDRSLTTRYSVGLDVFEPRTGRTTHIQVPNGLRISGAQWSPDGKQIAFFGLANDSTHIYVADPNTGRARKVTRTPVLATFGTRFDWADKGAKIVTVLVPDKRPPHPGNGATPNQPLAMVTDDKTNSLRVYASLLQTERDQEMLVHYVTGQLAVLDVRSGSVRNVGEPAMITSVEPSPAGDYFIVTLMEKPFSYIVPTSNFGSRQELWDASGKVLTELDKRPLRTGAPNEQGQANNQDQRRSLAWRPDGNGLSYLQQEPAPQRQGGSGDGGETDEQRGGGRGAGGGQGEQNQQQGPRRKDRVMHWSAPFREEDKKVIFESDNRIGSVRYSADCQTLFLSETASGTETVYAVRLSEPAKRYTISRNRTADFYENPGSLMTKPGPLGLSVVRISEDGKVFLSGTQYSKEPLKEAPRPFLDSVIIENGTKDRIWQSSPDWYETVSAVLDDNAGQVVISRQSATVVPNYYLLDTRSKQERKLTENRDYTPDITMAPFKRFQVTRADGFKFWVEVTLPIDYQPGQRLPAFFWFYPSEFTDQANYDQGQRTHNKNSFRNMGSVSKQYLTKLGYVFVEPDCPIVGPQGRMNDNYVHDLRSSLSAVIDALDREGWIDRSRLAIGGHSYGAFSTANALIHTPFFKAGIAGDGNYNRSLTPLAFQRESRLLWEARETYTGMSPLLHVQHLTGAMLMYHGADDQNVGTAPIHSEHMYRALEALGKPAALYMYPYEDHGQVAEETILDMWARWVAWLDKYVKNAK